MKRILTLGLIAVTLTAWSQQDPQWTHYMFNQVNYNPGAAGLDGSICVNGLYRSQWMGFEGAPVTMNLNASMPLDVLHGGMALGLMRDEEGFLTRTNVKLSYSYHLDAGDGKLGIGAYFGFLDAGISQAEWIDPNGGNGSGDAVIPQSEGNSIAMDAGIGAMYRATNWYAGVSITHLPGLDNQIGAATNLTQSQHLYFTGGYDWELTPEWTLMPSALIKYDLASISFDATVLAMYNNQFWGGVSYRLEDGIPILLGYQLNDQLRFGASYDIGTSALSGNNSSGSFEAFVNYCFTIEIPPKEPTRYRNVRFL